MTGGGTAAPAGTARQRVVLFSVAGHQVAIALEAVTEIVRAAWPIAIPRAPFGCLGFLDLRGEPLPFLDLAALLGWRRPLRPADSAEQLVDRHVVIVRPAAGPLALLVDRVLNTVDADRADHQPLPTRAGAPAAAVAFEGGEVTALIDPASLLGPRRRRLLERAAGSLQR